MAFYRFGTLDFQDGECDLVRTNVRLIPSPRGQRMLREVTHFIRATLIADTQADLSTRIAEVQTAFGFDYQNAGLYLDSSTPSRHLLSNDDPLCVSGVHVIQASFPEGGGDEYVTARTFSATISATYDDAESHLLEWEESVEVIGTGGPRVEFVDTYFGPQRRVIAQRTPQRIIQRGSALGYGIYILPPGPLLPENEHLDQRVISQGAPRFLGRQYRMFPSSWTYYHTVVEPSSVVPTPPSTQG